MRLHFAFSFTARRRRNHFALSEVYARSEVEAILTAPRQPRDRVLLMTVYGCGLRISEATQLKTSDIDRARMQLRVRNGKGAKGRVLPLSERLLKELVNYWRAQRQGKAGHDSPWLFLGKKSGSTDEYIRRAEHLLQRVEKERCALQRRHSYLTPLSRVPDYRG